VRVRGGRVGSRAHSTKVTHHEGLALGKVKPVEAQEKNGEIVGGPPFTTRRFEKGLRA